MTASSTAVGFPDVIYDSLVASQAEGSKLTASFVLSQVEWRFIWASAADAATGCTAMGMELPGCYSVAVGRAKSRWDAEFAAWRKKPHLPMPELTAQDAGLIGQYDLIMAVVDARRSRMRHNKRGLAVKTGAFLDMVGGFENPKKLTIGARAIWATFGDIWVSKGVHSTAEHIRLSLFVNEMVMVSAAASHINVEQSAEFLRVAHARLGSVGIAGLVAAREAIIKAIWLAKGAVSKAAALRVGKAVLERAEIDTDESEDADFDTSETTVYIGGVLYRATSGVVYTTGPLRRRALSLTDLTRLLCVVTSVCSSMAAIVAQHSSGTIQNIAKCGMLMDAYSGNVDSMVSRADTAGLGVEPEFSRSFPRCRFNFFLNESTVEGVYAADGVAAAATAWASIPEATESMIRKTYQTTMRAREAISYGLDTVAGVFLMSFYLGFQLREWIAKTDPAMLAAWSFCPKEMGGLGIPNALQLMTEVPGDGVAEGMGTLQVHAGVDSAVRRFFMETLRTPLAGYTAEELAAAPLFGAAAVGDARMSGSQVPVAMTQAIEDMFSLGELSPRVAAFLAHASVESFEVYCALLIERGPGGMV